MTALSVQGKYRSSVYELHTPKVAKPLPADNSEYEASVLFAVPASGKMFMGCQHVILNFHPYIEWCDSF